MSTVTLLVLHEITINDYSDIAVFVKDKGYGNEWARENSRSQWERHIFGHESSGLRSLVSRTGVRLYLDRNFQLC